MAWGFITIDGPGELVFIQGNMNQTEYKKTLEQYLLPFLSSNPQQSYVFQQDGAPCYTAKSIKDFMEENNIELLEWAAQSPDLNPIEHVWAIIKRILGNKKFVNFEELKNEIRRIWEKDITKELCETLIINMPKRAKALISARGGHTSY